MNKQTFPIWFFFPIQVLIKLPVSGQQKCLSLVIESLSSVVLLGYSQPSLAGIGVPWVLTGTHRCALMPRVASRQSANPLVAGVQS